MSKAEAIRLSELNKTLRHIPPLPDHEREHLEAMTKSIVTRILKEPIQYLKGNGSNGHTEFIKELFNLQARESDENKNRGGDPGEQTCPDSDGIGGEQAEVVVPRA